MGECIDVRRCKNLDERSLSSRIAARSSNALHRGQGTRRIAYNKKKPHFDLEPIALVVQQCHFCAGLALQFCVCNHHGVEPAEIMQIDLLSLLESRPREIGAWSDFCSLGSDAAPVRGLRGLTSFEPAAASTA